MSECGTCTISDPLDNNTGSNNTADGGSALYSNITGSSDVALGVNAGYNETGSNHFYVNDVQENSLANDQQYSLMYGAFSGTAGSLTGQQLTINGWVVILVAVKVPFL